MAFVYHYQHPIGGMYSYCWHMQYFSFRYKFISSNSPSRYIQARQIACSIRCDLSASIGQSNYCRGYPSPLTHGCQGVLWCDFLDLVPAFARVPSNWFRRQAYRNSRSEPKFVIIVLNRLCSKRGILVDAATDQARTRVNTDKYTIKVHKIEPDWSAILNAPCHQRLTALWPVLYCGSEAGY